MVEPNHYADMYNAYDKNQKKIRILDSTLREGEQHPGVSFTNKHRIQIARMLDYFGVNQIEISPVVSEDHREATRTIIKQGLKADIVSHGGAISTPRWGAMQSGALHILESQTSISRTSFAYQGRRPWRGPTSSRKGLSCVMISRCSCRIRHLWKILI